MRNYNVDYDPSKLHNKVLRDYWWAATQGTGEDHANALDAVWTWLLFNGVEVVDMTERGDESITLHDIATGERLPYYELFPTMIFEGLREIRPDLFDMVDDLS